jgi:hypothetical protein
MPVVIVLIVSCISSSCLLAVDDRLLKDGGEGGIERFDDSGIRQPMLQLFCCTGVSFILLLQT